MLKLTRYLKPYTVAIIATLVFVFIQVLGDLYLPSLMADVVNEGVLQGSIAYIWKMGGFMLVVSVIGTVFSILATFYASRISAKFGYDLRHAVFTHIEEFSLTEFDKIGTSSLINRTTNDVSQVQNLVMMILRMLVMAPMMCIGGIIMAVNQNKELSAIFIIVIPVLILAITLIMTKAIPFFKALQVKLDKLNLVLRENLIGIRVIRAFTRTPYEQKRFDNANKSLMDTAVKINQIMALSWPLMMLIMNISTVAIVWFGSQRIDAGSMNVGDLMAFIQYGMQIMFSLLMFSMMLVMVPRAQASAIRIAEVLNVKPSIENSPLNKAVPTNGSVELAFNQVSFTYPGAESPAVSKLNFTCHKGTVTAFIGGTGSGKSTIVNLIERFYDTTEGEIVFNGEPIQQLALDSYRKAIAVVPQKTTLFSGTVLDNIRYGKEDASMEEIKSAAAIAQADTFIDQLEGDYNYIVTQGGTNLSGGQKQRLSIARAIVRRPLIYVFDDSFSALDYKTDAKLRAALKSEIKDAIVIIIAQRVSTVMDADQIIVLHEGQIVGIGNHDELMRSSEVYQEIVDSQLSKEEQV